MRQSRCRSRQRHLLIIVLLIAVFPRVGHAQVEALNALLSRITSINAYGTYAFLRPASSEVTTHRPGRTGSRKDAMSGAGVEFLFEAARFRREKPGANPVTRLDLKGVTVKKSTQGDDSTFTLEPTVIPDTLPAWGILEVALGYSQVSGFYSKDQSVDFRASVRELPSLAFYLTLLPQKTFSPYLGFRSGLVQLHQGRMYDTTAVGLSYSVDAQTFQAGPVFGLGWGLGDANLFAEAAYMNRNFPALNISGKDGSVPARFPRSLHLSGIYLQAGLQFDIGKSDKK